jgi:hypothetical protein
VADIETRERARNEVERLRATGDRLDRQVSSVSKELSALTEQVEQTRIKVAEGLTAIAVENKFQQITDVLSSLQSNAYGERGSVLATTNLLLAANQMFWTLLNPLLTGAGVLSKSGSGTLTILTPIGSFLTGQLLLADRQHQRFITGVSTMDQNGMAIVTLRSYIAESEWPAFQRRTDVVVTLNVIDGLNLFNTFANVTDGVLTIRITPRMLKQAPGMRVAWMIDTGIGDA